MHRESTMPRQRQEDTDIDQHVYPRLHDLGIPRENIKRDISTNKTGRLRGDLWIADVQHAHHQFNKRILALIECKDHYATLDDADWLDAKSKGQIKARQQGLNAFFVTNTNTATRCYNASDLTEIVLDGTPISDFQTIPILKAIQTQVSASSSLVSYHSFAGKAPDPKQFRATLWNLRQVFRARGISKGSEDSMIKTTLTFCILKLISDQQQLARTIPQTIYLWNDWRPAQMDRDIANTIKDLTDLPRYKHLMGCLAIDRRLDAEACGTVHREISPFSLYGSDFDFFGLIYESLANTQLKKDFGEFYTPRHIIRTIVRTRLQDEQQPRPLAICDPACGTGGFLVEAFICLQNFYRISGQLTGATITALKEHTFHGFDTNDEVAIPSARTNMMMADDGGANILATEDSLNTLPTNQYDYILTNIPYGKYDGTADMSTFSYTNSKRYELLFIDRIAHALKPGGKAAVIVPDGLVESTSYSQFRYKLLLDTTVEAVISLHSDVFEPYTGEKTYIIYLTRKLPAQQGTLQTTPIWHFILDEDGFQKGKKRYSINADDRADWEAGFLSAVVPFKAGFVPIDQVNKDNFYSFCSESYLRRPAPIDVPLSVFDRILTEANVLIGVCWTGLYGEKQQFGPRQTTN